MGPSTKSSFDQLPVFTQKATHKGHIRIPMATSLRRSKMKWEQKAKSGSQDAHANPHDGHPPFNPGFDRQNIAQFLTSWVSIFGSYTMKDPNFGFKHKIVLRPKCQSLLERQLTKGHIRIPLVHPCTVQKENGHNRLRTAMKMPTQSHTRTPCLIPHYVPICFPSDRNFHSPRDR